MASWSDAFIFYFKQHLTCNFSPTKAVLPANTWNCGCRVIKRRLVFATCYFVKLRTNWWKSSVAGTKLSFETVRPLILPPLPLEMWKISRYFKYKRWNWGLSAYVPGYWVRRLKRTGECLLHIAGVQFVGQNSHFITGIYSKISEDRYQSFVIMVR